MVAYCLVCAEFCKMKQFRTLIAQVLRIFLIPLNCTLKMVKMLSFILCAFYNLKNTLKNKMIVLQNIKIIYLGYQQMKDV